MRDRWTTALAAALLLCAAVGPLAAEEPPDEELSDEQLVELSGCFECHSVEEKVVGPAYRDVAARYRDDAEAREALIDKVKRGGKGNWLEVTGEAPMPPHGTRLTHARIARLIDWVLRQGEAAPRDEEPAEEEVEP